MQLLWLPLSIFYCSLFLNVYSSDDRSLYDCSFRETLSYVDAVFYLNIYTYRITSNKRRGRSFNFLHFWGAFIQGRRLFEGGVYYKIQKKIQFYISTSMISLSSILKTALSAASTSGICDQMERVRTTRFV